MEFTVPQFIEKEPKLLGPFNLRQFVYMAVAGGASFFLYFTMGKTNFWLFVLISILLFGAALALSFLKIKGYDLVTYIKNFLFYVFSGKIFIWKRKIISPKITKMRKFQEEETKEETELKIATRSRLQKLFTQVETKKRK